MDRSEARAAERLAGVSCFDPELVERARRRLPLPTGTRRAVRVLSTLAEPTRLRIAVALYHVTEACVSDLCHIVGGPPSAISHKLRRLGEAGLVAKRREGKKTFYSLRDPVVALLLSRLL